MIASLVVSITMIVAAVLLFIFHFILGISAFWFTLPLAVAALTNLIRAIVMVKKKKQIAS